MGPATSAIGAAAACAGCASIQSTGYRGVEDSARREHEAIAQIARPEFASTVRERAAGNLLAFLVELMIEREADKFGEAVDEVMSVEQRRHFVRNLLRREVLGLLKEHDLVREEQRASSGKNSDFFHIKQASDILREDRQDPRIAGFYSSLVAKIRDLPKTATG